MTELQLPEPRTRTPSAYESYALTNCAVTTRHRSKTDVSSRSYDASGDIIGLMQSADGEIILNVLIQLISNASNNNDNDDDDNNNNNNNNNVHLIKRLSGIIQRRCMMTVKLRSSSHILLQVPVSRLKSYGDCAFSVAAPTLWNRLPADVRNASSLENLKSILKTHLFKVAFTDK